MANTLLDIAKANAADSFVGVIEESIRSTPEVKVGFARTIPGINFKTLVRTSLPTAGYRGANEGVDAVSSTFENRLVECFILNPRWECDKAVADAYVDGAEAFIALEAKAMTEASMRALSKQFYYGADHGADAKGGPGLLDMYDSTNMVVDATGAAAGTGSSVWAVKFGLQDVAFVYGQDGEIAVSDVMIGNIIGSNSKVLTGYIQEVLARPGVQVGSVNSVARIKKLTAESGHTLTDDMISDLLAVFPEGVEPDYLFMTKRSRKQLQQSRTATNPTGAPAPIPEEAFGVPILTTSGILNTEDLSW